LANDALLLDRIEAYYVDSHVLHQVSFALGEARLLGLLGRNGAGKTTSMNVAVGLLKPRAGRVAVGGTDVTGNSPEAIAARGMALVPQGRRIFRSLSVHENLAVAQRKPRHAVAAAWNFDRVYTTFPRLKERQHQVAGFLSGGEQQMLAIGRALMSRPRLLMLDEPSLGLAPLIARQIFDAIRTLNRQDGLTVLIVEQNANHALKLAHRGYVMVNGLITLSGTGSELLQRPEIRAAYLEGGRRE
jgi:branched-chain amino acid transport system ATP-binding protein